MFKAKEAKGQATDEASMRSHAEFSLFLADPQQ